jgi:hypothetical protein
MFKFFLPCRCFLGALVQSRKTPVKFRYFLLSFCLNESVQLPLDGFLWNLLLGALLKTCQWAVPLDKIRHFTWRPKYVIFLPATLNHSESANFDRNGIRSLGQRHSVTLHVPTLPILFISVAYTANSKPLHLLWFQNTHKYTQYNHPATTVSTRTFSFSLFAVILIFRSVIRATGASVNKRL